MFSSNTSQVSSDATYIEDVFSTYLYTGNGSTQTITNGIDLAGKGGLVWAKKRTSATDENHVLFDTARGQPWLSSNTTNAQLGSSGLINYNADGFGWLFGSASWNSSGVPYASWTFRKAPKFFDVVTYTGTGSNRTVSHNLGSVPGCIIIKEISSAGEWAVYHRSIGATKYLRLETDQAATTSSFYWNNTSPTSTSFSLGAGTDVNESGQTYVAYLFAHNAGGFGLTGTDNVISCGSYTGNGSSQDINLGYEAQWVLVKNATTAGWDWYTIDNMRGFVVTPASPNFTKNLSPNTSGAESDLTAISPSSTGFRLNSSAASFNSSGATYIYIAIRRGPMKVPTSGTSVFSPISTTAAINSTTPATLTPEASDWWMNRSTGTTSSMLGLTRLTGWGYLNTTSTAAEDTSSYIWTQKTQSDLYPNASFRTAVANIRYFFKRAPGCFDVVCYTGTGSARTVTHNLGVAPELMIVKSRSSGTLDWLVYSAPTGNANALLLNTTDASFASTSWGNTTPTASVFSTGTSGGTNNSGATFVAYLFASCPGVSKVGIYTGTGGTQTISCGFAARFVLIKRTNSTGNWFVWDTARGMVAGTDPRLALNTTAAELNDNWVYTNASGFQIVTTDATVNASGGSYIYLAIA